MGIRPTRTSGRRKSASPANLDCATAFQKIALDCVTAINTHREAAGAGDAEAVHQVRVAITRLRAAVVFFAPIALDAEWLRLKAEIAWLNGFLGAARDSDVVVSYARRKRYLAWAQRMIGGQLDQGRMQDHGRLLRSMRSTRFQRLIVALARWINRGPWLARWQRKERREPLEAYCKRELNRRRERLIRQGRRLEKLDAARRHRLRIRIKRFRYMLEALTEADAMRGCGEFHRLHRPAKRLQRVLGDLRDLERFAGLAAEPPPAADHRPNSKPPPGYRRRREALLDAAIEAYRSLKQAGA